MAAMTNPKKAAKPQNAAKKTESKSGSTGAAPAPLIDPGQSAAAAAALVANKVSASSPAQGPKAESSGFRNLKQSMIKPHAQTIGGVLDKMAPAGQKRSAAPFGAGKQVGHNQTFGADVSRRNVPRRTNG